MSTQATIKGYSCPSCGWADVLAAAKCPRCRGTIQETVFPGKGVVATFTVIRYPPSGFENESPYTVALVDLENGPRVIGRVAGDRNMSIGQRVSFVRETGGILEFSAKS